MLFAAAKRNQMLTESPKISLSCVHGTLKGQFFQIFYTLTTCNVRIQAVGKVLSSGNIHGNSV